MKFVLFSALVYFYFCFTYYFVVRTPTVVFEKEPPLEPYRLLSAIAYFEPNLSEDDNCYYSDLIFYSNTYLHTYANYERVLEQHSVHYWGYFVLFFGVAVINFSKSYLWSSEHWLLYTTSLIVTILLTILSVYLVNRNWNSYHYSENTSNAKIFVREPLSEKREHKACCYEDSYQSDYLACHSEKLHYSNFKSFSEYIKSEYEYSAKILTGRINAMEAQIEFILTEPQKHIIGSIAFLAICLCLF